MSTPFYMRRCKMHIGLKLELKYPPIMLEFETSFQANTPSQTKAKIYNPSPETIDACRKTKDGYAPVTILAGYGSNTGTCVAGEITKFEVKKSGNDTTLELTVGDAAWKWQNSIVNRSWSGRITAEAAIHEVLEDVGIVPAKVELAENKIYERGLAFVGRPLWSVMNGIAKDTKSEFFFRNGQACFLAPVKGYGQAFVLSPSTGLLEANPADYGFKIKMLFQHLCGPGSLLSLESGSTKINLRVRSGKHQFSPIGKAITEVEAIRI